MPPDAPHRNLLLETFSEFLDDNCMEMAAALAFYAILSFAPLLLLGIELAGLLVDPRDIQAEASKQIQVVMGPDGDREIQSLVDAVHRHHGGARGSVINFVILAVGATGVVIQLQSSLNRAWQVAPDPKQGGLRSFLVKRALTLATIPGVALLLLLSLLLSAVANTFSGTLRPWLPGGISVYVPIVTAESVSFVVITVLFAAVFKLLPDARIAWRDVWSGAAITGVLFTIGKFLIGLYLSRWNPSSTYGAAGSLVLILLWTYYSSMIFFLGAEFTQTWARRKGKVIRPAPGAIRVERRRP